MFDDEDPIAEIHRIRKAMYVEAGGTPSGFVKYLRLLERKHEDKLKKPTPSAQVGKTGKRRRAIRTKP